VLFGSALHRTEKFLYKTTELTVKVLNLKDMLGLPSGELFEFVMKNIDN
jgi:hypothetical protein